MLKAFAALLFGKPRTHYRAAGKCPHCTKSVTMMIPNETALADYGILGCPNCKQRVYIKPHIAY